MRDKQPRVGVASIVVISGGRVILGRRARGGNKGMLVLPGGGVELGENWKAAGEREFLEETGLRVKITSDLVRVMEIIGESSHRICLVANAKLEGPISDMHDTEELSEVWAWLPEQIPVNEVSPPVREILTALHFIREK